MLAETSRVGELRADHHARGVDDPVAVSRRAALPSGAACRASIPSQAAEIAVSFRSTRRWVDRLRRSCTP